MITMRRQLLGLGFVAASSLVALHAAQALTGPQAISIDGGPLGSLSLSGGLDGYAYFDSNTANDVKTNGMNVANSMIELQKTTGQLQFTLQIASSNTITLGTLATSHPGQTSISNFSTGPIYAGYLTLAPTGSPVTISAGMLNSLEGYEAGFDWFNPVQLATSIYYVQNSQARGVEGNYTHGPLSVTVEYGDGFDTGVFNFVQALATYTFNSSNVLNVYGAGNLGRTSNNAKIYSGTCNYGDFDLVGLLRHGRRLWLLLCQLQHDRHLLQLHQRQPERGAGSAVCVRQG